MAQVIKSTYSYITGALTVGNDNAVFQEGSTAFGSYSTASGRLSHAVGTYNYASATYSIAEGYMSNAYNDFQHSVGRYNVTYTHTGNNGWGPYQDSTLFAVGNGEENSRKNAFEVRQDGTTYLYGPHTYISGELHTTGKTTFDTFTNVSNNNYVTYTTGETIKTNSVKFVSDINLDTHGTLTYHVSKITYATGAAGGTENKGVISVDTTTLNGVGASTNLGLTISDGIIKLTKIIDPIITTSGSDIIACNSTSVSFSITSNNYTRVTDSVSKPIVIKKTYSGVKTGTDTININPAIDPAISTTTSDTISFTAPNSSATDLTIAISKNVSTDYGTASGTRTIKFRWPIYTAATANATTGTRVGWTTDTDIDGSCSKANYNYIFIYENVAGGSGKSQTLKYSWNSSANTTAGRIGTVTAYGKTYSVYDLGKTNATVTGKA